MRRLPAIMVAALLVAACSTQPPPTGPGTATFDISGNRGDCWSFGGCEYHAILRTDDQPQALDDMHDAELHGFPDLEAKELRLGEGLPRNLGDGGYTLTFEERLMSDEISNVGPRDYGLGATCTAEFTIGPGTHVVVVRVAFPQPSREPRRCTIRLSVKAAA